MFFLLTPACFTQVAKAPERKVDIESSSLTSDRDPKVQIKLPKQSRYIGADRWNLYDVADCEVHVFVEGSGQKVEQMYWVQFEGYLPEKPALHHTYDSPRHMDLGGMDFYVDTWARSNDEPMKQGSDREHVQKLIAAKDWKMPAKGMMYTRLVHLLDKENRKELMIIYGESLEPWNVTAEDLKEGGKAHAHWPELERGMLVRLKDKVDIKDLEGARQ
jgi:hypothetical protein